MNHNRKAINLQSEIKKNQPTRKISILNLTLLLTIINIKVKCIYKKIIKILKYILVVIKDINQHIKKLIL